ncbi:isocitrate lyase/PEP mutase family protein [Pseudochelatococcus sp. B33]
MTYTERRQALRVILQGPECLSPASVYDPLSARIAQDAGFRIGLLSGSVVAATTLGAPDLLLHTLTEFTDQIRKVTRASDISLLTDADNGFGHALNVMRTVQEFEHAGVSAMSVEDTAPAGFGEPISSTRLVPAEEMAGKLKAALAARSDPAFILAARTKSLAEEGLDAAVARVKAYSATGVDAIWLVTVESLEQLRAIRAVTRLPFIIGTNHGALTRDQLASVGARIMLQGHLPIAAAVKALTELYDRLARGDEPAALEADVASAGDMDRWLNAQSFENWAREFMQTDTGNQQ